MRAGQTSSALPLLQRAPAARAAGAPGASPLWHRAARMMVRYERAAALFRRAALLDQPIPRHGQLSAALVALGHAPAARAAARRAIRSAPDLAGPLRARAAESRLTIRRRRRSRSCRNPAPSRHAAGLYELRIDLVLIARQRVERVWRSKRSRRGSRRVRGTERSAQPRPASHCYRVSMTPRSPPSATCGAGSRMRRSAAHAGRSGTAG